MDPLVAPTHTIDFTDQIFRVEFSPYEWSQNVICIALANKIAVGNVKFQVYVYSKYISLHLFYYYYYYYFISSITVACR